MNHKLIICVLLFFIAPFFMVAKKNNSTFSFQQISVKNSNDDSLRKNKTKGVVAADFEKNEYTHIGDKYNKFCERLLVNDIADGYTDKQSYNPGDTVKLYLSATGPTAAHKIYLFNVLMKKVDSLICITYSQTPSAVKPWEDYGYTLTWKYVIPSNLKSGMYNFGKAVFFIVKNPAKNADITIVYPSNTEAAYNNAGGKSLYAFNSSGGINATTVTFRRPLSNFILTEIQGHSYPFLKWLKSLDGYSIQYIQDVDLDNYAEIANTKLLVVIGHSEYWTKKARLNFDKFVNVGNDAAVLSGNTMCWQVRYKDDNSRLICYKSKAADSTVASDIKTILWTDTTLNYPVLRSIGCDWYNGAYGMHNAHGKYGYTILKPNSPLFEGTGLGFRSFLSCQSYEYDATLFLGFNADMDPILDSTSLGFCKIELLAYDWGNSTSATQYMPKGFGTFIAFKKMPGSGIVVNCGFNTFTGKTPSYGSGGICGPDSALIRTITLNTFSKLLNKQNVFTIPNDCTINGIQENYNNSSLNKLLIYPNPGQNNFAINTNLQETKHPKLELYDCFGKLVFSEILETGTINKLNLSGLAAGAYIYIFYDEARIITRNKLVIIR